MNFLAHHAVARRADRQASSELFAGNLLPDLIALDHRGKLRLQHVARQSGELARGVRLHLVTDRVFHQHPLFAAGMARASERLRSAPLSAPPRRVFFLAHVAVELALDGLLLRREPQLADDLYARLGDFDPAAIARTAGRWREGDGFPGLEETIRRFLRHRWLENYQHNRGLAEGLRRIALRANAGGFSDVDLPVLSSLFDELIADLADSAENLLREPVSVWYNSAEDSALTAGKDHRHADDHPETRNT